MKAPQKPKMGLYRVKAECGEIDIFEGQIRAEDDSEAYNLAYEQSVNDGEPICESCDVYVDFLEDLS